MLVLSRKKQESIVIGDGITIAVLDFTGNRVRLGITAPAGVKIVRHELLTVPKMELDSKPNSAA
jgi:carbon storage regulator